MGEILAQNKDLYIIVQWRVQINWGFLIQIERDHLSIEWDSEIPEGKEKISKLGGFCKS